MIIDLSDCEEYKEFLVDAYPFLKLTGHPSQFQVEADGIRYWGEVSGEYFVSYDIGNQNWEREFALLKKLFPEAFL